MGVYTFSVLDFLDCDASTMSMFPVLIVGINRCPPLSLQNGDDKVTMRREDSMGNQQLAGYVCG